MLGSGHVRSPRCVPGPREGRRWCDASRGHPSGKSTVRKNCRSHHLGERTSPAQNRRGGSHREFPAHFAADSARPSSRARHRPPALPVPDGRTVTRARVIDASANSSSVLHIAATILGVVADRPAASRAIDGPAAKIGTASKSCLCVDRTELASADDLPASLVPVTH